MRWNGYQHRLSALDLTIPEYQEILNGKASLSGGMTAKQIQAMLDLVKETKEQVRVTALLERLLGN